MSNRHFGQLNFYIYQVFTQDRCVKGQDIDTYRSTAGYILYNKLHSRDGNTMYNATRNLYSSFKECKLFER